MGSTTFQVRIFWEVGGSGLAWLACVTPPLPPRRVPRAGKRHGLVVSKFAASTRDAQPYGSGPSSPGPADHALLHTFSALSMSACCAWPAVAVCTDRLPAVTPQPHCSNPTFTRWTEASPRPPTRTAASPRHPPSGLGVPRGSAALIEISPNVPRIDRLHGSFHRHNHPARI